MTGQRPQNGGLGAGAAVRRLLVDSPTSVGAGTRARRWNVIRESFPDLPDMTVVDLGGTVESWLRAPVRPARVTVVNLFEPGVTDEPWLTPVTGDACGAREALAAAGVTHGHDLVFSNSLIEHVGGHAKRSDLAREVGALAPFHWIQTPYRYFPVEPHWLFPLLQFLPVRIRSSVAERWPLAHSRPAGGTDALSEVLWTELVSLTELRFYFPGSRIYRERLVGLTKSISAVKSPKQDIAV